jgi:hemerythrin-like domain-containing protein
MAKYAPRNDEGKHRILDDDHAAIALLKDEHHVFRRLFDEAEDAEGEALADVARELCMRLNVHMTIEEEILYPALKSLGEDELADEVNEGVVEHQAGKYIIAELEQLDGTEELFKAKVHVLGEETIHHIDEEDEELFEDAKQAHAEGRIDLDEIGRQLRDRQAELYDDIAEYGEAEDTGEAEANEVQTAATAETSEEA